MSLNSYVLLNAKSIRSVRNLSKEKGRNRNTFFFSIHPTHIPLSREDTLPDFKFNFQSRKWVFDTYCFLHKSCCCNAPGIFHANTSLWGFPLLYFPLFHMTLQERFREISAQFRGKNRKKMRHSIYLQRKWRGKMEIIFPRNDEDGSQ